MSKKRILVVDDDASIKQVLKFIFSAKGYEVTTAGNGHKALEKVNEKKYDIAFVDYNLPGINGVEISKCLKDTDPQIKVIIMSGDFLNENHFNKTVKNSKGTTDGFIAKPFLISDLESYL